MLDESKGPVIVGTRGLAQWLGLSENSVRKYTREGVLVKEERDSYDLRSSVTNYCGHLRMRAAGRGGEGSDIDSLATERARLTRLQSEKVQLQLDQLRGELVEVAEAERAWSDTLRTVRSCMLAVPSRIRQRLGHLTVADVEAIDFEVRSALMEAGGDEVAEASGMMPDPLADTAPSLARRDEAGHDKGGMSHPPLSPEVSRGAVSQTLKLPSR